MWRSKWRSTTKIWYHCLRKALDWKPAYLLLNVCWMRSSRSEIFPFWNIIFVWRSEWARKLFVTKMFIGLKKLHSEWTDLAWRQCRILRDLKICSGENLMSVDVQMRWQKFWSNVCCWMGACVLNAEGFLLDKGSGSQWTMVVSVTQRNLQSSSKFHWWMMLWPVLFCKPMQCKSNCVTAFLLPKLGMEL